MESLEIGKLREMEISTLKTMGQSYGIDDGNSLRKDELIARILEEVSEKNIPLYGKGVLQILDDRDQNYGFLRSPRSNYFQSDEDIYVSSSQIRLFGLQTGHVVEGLVRPPKKSENKTERYYALLQIEKVNGEPPELVKSKIPFDDPMPVFPYEQFKLEHKPFEFGTRIIDLISPIGKGQRGLIVAPPYCGKTTLLKNIACGIEANHPETSLIFLLIDERPEEVTDVRRTVQGEVISSTFDEPPERHIQVGEMALEKAKRMVESGEDVVILLDSMTRFARAHNMIAPSSGRTLTGGLDAMAFVKPRRFCGAARKFEEGGSLTIIASVLVDTESRSDTYIYEEFKGTANMEIHMDRTLLELQIFPAINIEKSRTRREELLLKPEVLNKVWALRKFISQMSMAESMELLLQQFSKYKTNEEFLDRMTAEAGDGGKPRPKPVRNGK
ncbi:MAG: transcription termination factor Rho [Candidatus Poribacteria bacterium]|nr:transcription termination factor Rho [Candidatus Poribacteria bacterium]